MKPGERFRFEDGSFLAIVLLVTVGFAVVIAPFFGAILWGLVLTIMFEPVNRWLLERMPNRPNGAALLTLLLLTLSVILPTIFLGLAIADELVNVYTMLQTGQINPAALFDKAVAALPDSIARLLQEQGWTDFDAARDRASHLLTGSVGALAGRALSWGQSALNVVLMLGVMLYLTYFLLRDGEALSKRVLEAIPIDDTQRNALARNFVVVIRATMKGSLVVAIVQGFLGGITFTLLGIEGALLWGTLMGVFALIPAIGTGIVWLPVALYLLATGAVVKGLILIGVGGLIIGSVDNILRPVLVGRDTRMPDYVVLISTLGGLQVFGIHGLIVGPVIAALFISAWNIFADKRDA